LFKFWESCGHSFDYSTIDSLIWDFGDGIQLVVDSPDSTNINPIHLYNSNGTFPVQLIAVDHEGCRDSVIKSINIIPGPTASTWPDTSMCTGESISLTATGGSFYEWNTVPPLYTDTVIVSPTFTTTYTVTVTDDYGCTDSDDVTISVYDMPEINIGDGEDICIEPNLSLDAGVFDEWHWYLWNTGSSAQSIAVYQSGFYWVEVSNPGCTAKDSVEVVDCFEIVVPNVFTPNSDGFNDVFRIESKGVFALTVIIYNRWGKKIYEWNEVNGNWDGMHSGVKAADGVYFFVLTAKDYEGNEHTQQGSVTLIRGR